VGDVMYDVRPEQYPTVIREMIHHEDDVTNHRIMWLLIGEGFIANAYVSGRNTQSTFTYFALGLLATLVALSAFLMLYRSYRARGYLQFLGKEAKHGKLKEEDLPLTGWPQNRTRGWWRSDWLCQWFRQTSDLFEPWLLLPYLFTSVGIIVLLRTATRLSTPVVLILAVVLSAVFLSMSCVALVWSQSKDDTGAEGEPQASKAVGF